MGQACLLGQEWGTSPGLNTPLELLAARTLAETPLAERERAGGLGRERAAIPPGFAAPSRWGSGTGRAGARESSAKGRLASPPPPRTQSPKCLLRLQCEPFPASHPLHQSPRGGTLGGDRQSSILNHPHPCLVARREGVTWPRSGEEKMGRLPEPQVLSPCPGFRPLPCQGKITRKEQATTGLTYGRRTTQTQVRVQCSK